MKKYFLLLFIAIVPILGYSEVIDSSFKKTFLWSAYGVDNNLSGNIEHDKGDFFVNFPKNGKIVLEYKDFGEAGSLCFVNAYLPNLKEEGFIECPPIKLEDVKIVKSDLGFIVYNKLLDQQFILMESPAEDGSYGFMVIEPSLVEDWSK